MSFSVTEPSVRQKWFASILVISYAFITLLPLAWIVATGFKSSSDSIAYPPKVIFEPSVEGYVNLVTSQTRRNNEVIAEPRATPLSDPLVFPGDFSTQLLLDSAPRSSPSF